MVERRFRGSIPPDHNRVRSTRELTSTRNLLEQQRQSRIDAWQRRSSEHPGRFVIHTIESRESSKEEPKGPKPITCDVERQEDYMFLEFSGIGFGPSARFKRLEDRPDGTTFRCAIGYENEWASLFLSLFGGNIFETQVSKLQDVEPFFRQETLLSG